MRSIGQRNSQIHEKRLSRRFEGRKTPGSGSLWFAKGDVQTDDLLIEHKWTGKKSFTLQSSVLEKIFGEAVLTGRMPVLGLSLNNTNYVVICEDDFFELISP